MGWTRKRKLCRLGGKFEGGDVVHDAVQRSCFGIRLGTTHHTEKGEHTLVALQLNPLKVGFVGLRKPWFCGSQNTPMGWRKFDPSKRIMAMGNFPGIEALMGESSTISGSSPCLIITGYIHRYHIHMMCVCVCLPAEVSKVYGQL